MAGRVPFDPFGDMLAGYRQADADNKQDLSFNAALEGAWIGNDAKRLQDLYNRDTYGLAVQMAQNHARQSAQRTAVGGARHPGDIATANGYSLGAGLDWQTMYNNKDAWGDTKNNAFTAGLGVSDVNAATAVERARIANANTLFDANNYQPRSTDTWNQGQELWGLTRDEYMRRIAGDPSGGAGQPATVQLGAPPRVDFGPYLPQGWQHPPAAQLGAPPAITTTGAVVGGAPSAAQLGAPPVANPVNPPLPPNNGFNLQKWMYDANSPAIPYETALAQQQLAAAKAIAPAAQLGAPPVANPASAFNSWAPTMAQQLTPQQQWFINEIQKGNVSR